MFPHLVMADNDGNIFEHPELLMAGASGTRYVFPQQTTIEPLPSFTKLFSLPGCPPVGYNPSSGEYVTVESHNGQTVSAVASFLPPGFLRLLLPAADWTHRPHPFPLWAYSAVGWQEEGMVSPLMELDKTPRWSPEHYDDRVLQRRIGRYLARFPENRLIHHLAHCAVDYHCFAAKNLFLERWEAPLPVSRACNARCLGCLSEQPPNGCHPSHDRIAFTPRVDEIVGVAASHLEGADEALVSFGQGCEGEPLTELELLIESIRGIRQRTSRGVINLNTNGFSPHALVRLADAGLDSVRVSLASAQESLYAAYHKPNGYGIGDVIEALREAEQRGVYTMINYLVFPGVSDQPHEMEALVSLAQETNVRFIHLKNLNIDPKFYLDSIGAIGWAPGIGMEKLVDFLRFMLKDAELGYFNRWSLNPRLT